MAQKLAAQVAKTSTSEARATDEGEQPRREAVVLMKEAVSLCRPAALLASQLSSSRVHSHLHKATILGPISMFAHNKSKVFGKLFDKSEAPTTLCSSFACFDAAPPNGLDSSIIMKCVQLDTNGWTPPRPSSSELGQFTADTATQLVWMDEVIEVDGDAAMRNIYGPRKDVISAEVAKSAVMNCLSQGLRVTRILLSSVDLPSNSISAIQRHVHRHGQLSGSGHDLVAIMMPTFTTKFAA